MRAYLERGAAAGRTLSPAEYYAGAVPPANDLDAEIHKAIRRRGEEEASAGHGPLVERLDDATRWLRRELQTLPEDHLIRVYGDMVLRLDDYLVTRLIELVVHIDDLAASAELEPPVLPAEALETSIRTLIDIARLRHGDVAVLRALARRERDAVDALRVL